MTLAAKGLVALGALATTLLFWGACIYIRWYRDVFIPVYALTPVLLPPALVPGIALGLVAYRLPLSVKYRCSHCGWYECFRVWRPGYCPQCGRKLKAAEHWKCPNCWTPTPRAAAPASPHDIGLAQPIPIPVPRAVAATTTAGLPLDNVTDDTFDHDELATWIHVQLAAGRTVEEVTSDLVAQGWSEDDVAGPVEAGRRRTRHLRQ